MVQSINDGWVTARRMIIDRSGDEPTVVEDPEGELIEFCMQGDRDVVEEVELTGWMVRHYQPSIILQ